MRAKRQPQWYYALRYIRSQVNKSYLPEVYKGQLDFLISRGYITPDGTVTLAGQREIMMRELDGIQCVDYTATTDHDDYVNDVKMEDYE